MTTQWVFLACQMALLASILAAIFDKNNIAIVLYISACILIGYLFQTVTPAADLAWYRAEFEAIDSGNLLVTILQNNYEAGFFLCALALKSLLGTYATLGQLEVLILILPLLVRRVREQIAAVALFLLFPGSFLLIFNVVRQGISEFALLLYLLDAGWLFALLAIAFHRAGLMALAARFAGAWSRRSPLGQAVLIIALISASQLIVLTLGGAVIRGYDTLAFSPLSFIAKFAAVSLPWVWCAIWKRRATASVFFRPFYIVLAISLVSISVNGRIADRIVFYALPFSIALFHRSRLARSRRATFVVLIFMLTVIASLLPSYGGYLRG